MKNLIKQLEEIEGLTKEISTLKSLSEEETLGEDLEKEVIKKEKALEKLELLAYLSSKYDDKNAVVSIHAGQGGTEPREGSDTEGRPGRRSDRW